ncbi:MAG: Uma2 family endonuclease [Planctomycetes bacterium]|nr:Uma2 family endonuclease [Planctomycetota bacterium]
MNAIFPIRRFTVDEVMRMVDAGLLDDGERLELIDGTLVTMSPQNPPHATTTLLLEGRLREAFGSTYHVRQQYPLWISKHDMPEPDIALVRGQVRDYAKRHPSGPDTVLVIEVSHTTQRRDRAKADLYARGHVPVYWMLDLERPILIEHSNPQGGTYAHVVELSPDDHVTLPELDVVWRVGELFP